ncbi:uncharacterized protein LOC110848170 isoform X2 [Folsomia candida]|uniref:uncharacterized protein LOC110848170 isoform X2 n=1 Tax=Folsomia candida TaxID=158441 RepID=UPI000B9090D7|nr:uncharacterized protein LOC110848170 isoform X2 [Folsomia candida]
MATAGTDSGVETGNESNDLDDISINVNVINEMGDPISLEDCRHSSSFESGLNQFPNQSPGSDEKDVPPPPPPPTSPNICGSDLFLDDVGGGNEFSSDSLDGMQGDPAEDCELEEDDGGGGGDMDEMTMDRDFNEEQEHEDRQESSGQGSYTPSPPFLNDFPSSLTHPGRDNFNHLNNSGNQFAYQPSEFLHCRAASTMDGFTHAVGEFSLLHHHHQSTAFHSACSPPPVPPATPTNSNSCRALFEFPELPKLVCDFEPPAGLQSFLGVEPFHSLDGSNRSGYNVLNTSPSTNDCRSLIPYENNYEQHDLHQKVRMHTRVVRNKLYDNWSNLRREYNERRLRTSTSAGNHLMVLKLLGSGVDANAADELGRTPLHIAACKGFSEIVRLLLQHGANPNQKDSVGNTPLHLSACTNHFDVVTDLLRAGTDVSTLDNNGRNPLQLAQSKLKLIMQCAKSGNEDALRVKKEVQQIIEMMTEYLQKKGQDLEAELLNEFANRLTLSQTPQEVDDLLANLSSLSITSPHNPGSGGASGARSRAMTYCNPKTPPRNPYLIHHLNPNLARPRSASFSAPSSQPLPPPCSTSSSSSISPSQSSRNIIKPGILSRRSPTVHEEQQILMSQCNKD